MLPGIQDSDIIYFCNPNNPTGACANRDQVAKLVAFAKEHGVLHQLLLAGGNWLWGSSKDGTFGACWDGSDGSLPVRRA